MIASPSVLQITDDDHAAWYRELFGPSVTAGIVQAADLAGYRNGRVHIRRAFLTEAGSLSGTEARVSQIACFVLAVTAGRSPCPLPLRTRGIARAALRRTAGLHTASTRAQADAVGGIDRRGDLQSAGLARHDGGDGGAAHCVPRHECIPEWLRHHG
jgi:hypothetical protein